MAALVAKGRAQREAQWRRGLVVGVLGLGLTFAPAVALLFVPPSYAPIALGLMVGGIVLLAVGFLTVPRRPPKV